MELLNTLYVTVPGSYLRLDNGTLRVLQDEETRLRVPLHHLQSVVCFGHIGLSAPLMHELAESGISLVLLDEHARFKARLEGPTSGNVLLRRAQYERADDPEFCVAVARSCIAGKIRNCRQILQRGAREAKADADAAVLTRGAQDLAASVRALPQSAALDVLRGIEGDAARRYFECLPHLLRPELRDDFGMTARTRRPPLDPINALLSFLYSMWMNDCRSAVEATGLDPQVGYLHVIRPGRAALALDLMEEFRPFADRLALTLLNLKTLSKGDFEFRTGGAVSLTPEGRKKVVLAYQERKQDPMSHPLLEAAVPLGVLPFVQARLLARTVREEQDLDGSSAIYVPFLTH